MGIYSFSAAHAINQNVALRADITFYDIIDSTESGHEFSLGVPLYFKQMNSGFFLEPGYLFRSMKNEYSDWEGASGSEATVTTGPQILLGSHQSWDSGFNISYAFGAGRNLNKKDAEDVFINGYFRVGYAF
jgi:hypothetical protein